MLIELLQNGGQYSIPEVGLMFVMLLLALTISFSFHEFMHAFVADRLGDNTPRLLGRVTMNPIAHMDPMGTLLLLTVGFGWGKPVQFNPNNLRRFKSKRLMMIMVSLAGVFGNFLIALVAMLIIAIIMTATGFGTSDPQLYAVAYVYAGINGQLGVPLVPSIICYVLYYVYLFSLSLMAFNLLPIPPLDGFHVLEELLPYKARYTEFYRKFVQYGSMVLLVLIILGNFSRINILSGIMNLIQLPAKLIINLLVFWIGLI